VLQDIDTFLSSREVSETQTKSLTEITQNCRDVLKDAQSLVDRYAELGSGLASGSDKSRSLSSSAKRMWKRVTLEPDDVRDLRSRITSNVIMLSSFLDGASHATMWPRWSSGRTRRRTRRSWIG
jgi:hypothetical protein